MEATNSERKKKKFDICLRTKQIKTVVYFGSPKKKCIGSGICRVELPGHTNTYSICCNKAIAYISILSTERIQFNFLKESISDRAKNKYFQTREFIVEDDYFLPDRLTQRLKLCPAKIVQGSYTIQETELYYTVQCDSKSSV